MIAYFDCFSGAAGDMVLGALLDAGLPLAYLKKEFQKLPYTGYTLKLLPAPGPIRGVKLKVTVTAEPRERSYKAIRQEFQQSGLTKRVKAQSLAIFETLAKAEAKVHGVALKNLHLHEVGGLDSIIDIVGTAIGLDYFKFDAVYASPLPITRGFIKCAHGILPLPAPATLEIIKGIPLEPAPIKAELITPTGAAILKTVVKKFGDCPLKKITTSALGYGDHIFPGRLNALRLLIGEL